MEKATIVRMLRILFYTIAYLMVFEIAGAKCMGWFVVGTAIAPIIDNLKFE